MRAPWPLVAIFGLSAVLRAAENPLPNFGSTAIGHPPLSLKDMKDVPSLRAPSFPFAPRNARAPASPAPASPGGPTSRMPILEPNPKIDYKLLVQAPDPAVDFKMVVKDPELKSAK